MKKYGLRTTQITLVRLQYQLLGPVTTLINSSTIPRQCECYT